MTAIWNLRRGDLFIIEGCKLILEFHRMDGMYALAYTRTGQMVNICGNVTPLD